MNTIRGIVRTLSTILMQAVEDELLPANPALRLGRYLGSADAPESEPDPLTGDEVAAMLQVAHNRFPNWFPFVLCAVRTGVRLSELVELQWSDISWRGSYIALRRARVYGRVTTPKNYQRRRVDLSRQTRAELRLWRRRERASWLRRGMPLPDWVFSSVSGTPLDTANVRKALNRIFDGAELHRRGPHQLRHTYASLLL